MRTALADKLAAAGAQIGATLGSYAGAETAARFGDVNAEFAALTKEAGVYDLGWRAKIKVTGEDRVRWMNGMVTNNVRDLKPNEGNYNFVLSPQGRIQGDMYIYQRGDALLIDTEQSQREALLKLLDHFIIMDDVELQDVSAEMTSIGVQGPQATEVLKKIGIEPSCADPLIVCDVTWHGSTIQVTRMASDEFLTYELWMSPEVAPKLWDALVSAGAKPLGYEALEKFRVFAGVPKYGQDIREKDLPQETEQTHALHFAKGCYIGQEIVERIRSRGAVHRMFTGFRLTQDAAPGAEVLAEGKKIAELTSVARVPMNGHEKLLALGYIRREAGKPGSRFKVGDGEAIVVSLPFKDSPVSV
jgi:aminomethyltransferase